MLILLLIICSVYGAKKTPWEYMSDADVTALVGNLTSLPREKWNTEEGFQLCLSQSEERFHQEQDIFQVRDKVRAIAKGLYTKHKCKKRWPLWLRDFVDIAKLARRKMPNGTAKEIAFFSIVLYFHLGDYIMWGKNGLFSTEWYPVMDANTIQMVQLYSQYGDSFLFLFGGSLFFNCFESLVAIARRKHIFLILDDWSNAGNIEAHGGAYRGIARLLQHDEEHVSVITENAGLINTVKENLHSSLTQNIISNIHKLWGKRGLEMTFAGYLTIHEDFVGRAALQNCSRNLSHVICSSLEERVWERDSDGKNLMDRILNGRPRSNVMGWRRELLDAACVGVMPIDQKGRQEEICQELSRSWGIKVSVDRESHKALAIKMIEKICELERLSDGFKEILKKEVEEAFVKFTADLKCLVLMDCPVCDNSVVEVREIYQSAGFPLQETLESKDCSRQKKLLFLKMVINEIKGSGDIIVGFGDVGFSHYKYDKSIAG